MMLLGIWVEPPGFYAFGHPRPGRLRMPRARRMQVCQRRARSSQHTLVYSHGDRFLFFLALALEDSHGSTVETAQQGATPNL